MAWISSESWVIRETKSSQSLALRAVFIRDLGELLCCRYRRDCRRRWSCPCYRLREVGEVGEVGSARSLKTRGFVPLLSLDSPRCAGRQESLKRED